MLGTNSLLDIAPPHWSRGTTAPRPCTIASHLVVGHLIQVHVNLCTHLSSAATGYEDAVLSLTWPQIILAPTLPQGTILRNPSSPLAFYGTMAERRLFARKQSSVPTTPALHY